MSIEGYIDLERSITRYPGGISKGTLTMLMDIAEKMGRFSIADETVKRIFVPELDSILSHFREFPIDFAIIEIAVRRNMTALALRERPPGFQNNQEGNRALAEIQRAILEYEAIKVIRERSPEKVLTPVVHMDPANSVDALIRLGWTVPPQYAPIPHRLSQLIVNKSLHFKNEEIDAAIKSQLPDETLIKYVRMNLDVLRNLAGYAPRPRIFS